MDPWEVYENDDRPPAFFRVKDIDNGCYHDLSAATTVVTAKFRAKGTDAVLQTVVCTKVAGGFDGLVLFAWPAGGLDITATGRHEIEVSVSFNGSIQTAGTYYWTDNTISTDDTLPIRLKADF